MTQSELAQKAGVTQRLVSDFERGKVDIRVDTLCCLFIALDLFVYQVLASVWRAKTRIRRNVDVLP